MSHPIFNRNQQWICQLPDKIRTEQWVEDFFYWFFSIDSNYTSPDNFEKRENELKARLNTILEGVLDDNLSENLSLEFFRNLEQIHQNLEEDLEVFYDFDPAAKTKSEILLSYPGFFAITFYRIANWLWEKEVPVIPRLISEYVHSKTGIDIHPGAEIGKRFFIDHGTGVVVGETTVIGNDVKIYQGVTLGALVVSKELAEKKRHPTIEDNVIIYANATILGGNTKVGKNSIIGGNVWLTHSIPEFSLVYHKSEIIIKNNSPFPEPLNFVI